MCILYQFNTQYNIYQTEIFDESNYIINTKTYPIQHGYYIIMINRITIMKIT